MVVMDYLEDYECLFNARESLFHEDRERLREELTTSLKNLHQMGLVHGDVHDANMMMKKDQLRWKLVDFDWSGTIGQV